MLLGKSPVGANTLGPRATSGTSGREGWGAGRVDEHRDDANHAEPLLADFRVPTSNKCAASLARPYVSDSMRYEDTRTRPSTNPNITPAETDRPLQLDT